MLTLYSWYMAYPIPPTRRVALRNSLTLDQSEGTGTAKKIHFKPNNRHNWFWLRLNCELPLKLQLGKLNDFQNKIEMFVIYWDMIWADFKVEMRIPFPACLQVRGSKRLVCHADLHAISRRRTRGEQIGLFTARIRRMRECNIFSLFTLAGGGGGYPVPGRGGYPIQVRMVEGGGHLRFGVGGSPSRPGWWGEGRLPHLTSGYPGRV